LATDFRGLVWLGEATATAQASAPAGFTVGHAYKVKSCAVENVAAQLYAIILDDNLNPRAIILPTSGAGPFTFQ
jgi:hypothetical protein